MERSTQIIDEYTLAAFIAGTLPEQRRSEVVAYLAENADARELLHMAYEALQASHVTEEAAPPRPDEPAPPTVREPDRGAVWRPARRLQGLGRYAVATVVVFTVGLGLRLAFGPPTDALRSPLPAQAGEMAVQVSPSDLTIEWSPVADAYEYRIVVWDPQQARVVTRSETSAHQSDAAFAAELRQKLAAGHTYTLRIDAVDAQNRLLQSSASISFTPR